MDFGRLIRRAVLAPTLCCAMLWPAGTLRAASFAEFVDPHPAPGNGFGQAVVALSTGNVVITSPYDDAGNADAGAVYLFDGLTGTLISTLRGSTGNDHVGIDGVTTLSNGNFVVLSPDWDRGAVVDAGAATWGNGTTGVSGVVSVANSLVGTVAGDLTNAFVTALSNGNYVVRSPFWNNGAVADAGAATWGSGTIGVSGAVSAANSLIGSRASDLVGTFVWYLSNGNYVVGSPVWDNGAVANAGAATWGSGTTGVSGVVSSANSLVGSKLNDQVGYRTRPLSNGNYVVLSPNWDNGAIADAGAVTWGSGTTGVRGAVTSANSLVGSKLSDQVGSEDVMGVANGNYVVLSTNWDNGAIADAGAVTWGSGATGVSGVVSAANSLVGSTAYDRVGNVTVLSNGNYVVLTWNWDDGAIVDVGAATWGSGTTGVSGVVSAANSLVGSTAGDVVSINGVTALTNGNYVVASPGWDDGGIADAGAATWCDGTIGAIGPVSTANSLTGAQAGDVVGGVVTALSNGNYVVVSPFWSNGPVVDAGAVTWCDGTTGVSGTVSDANSLVGSTAGDVVGIIGATALPNGSYVVSSQYWDNGAIEDAGAVTWGSGTTGVSGVVSAANSLVGSTRGDFFSPTVTALSNGNYVVASRGWDNGSFVDAGAATWGSGTTGVSGVVSAANSLVGTVPNDEVGEFGVTALSSGNYVVASRFWDNAALADAGAVTWGSGTTGVTGTVSAANSLVGAAANTNLQPIVEDAVNHTFIAPFLYEDGGRVRVGPPTGTTAVEGGSQVAFALEGARPNPASGHSLRIAFTLSTGTPAWLQLLDVSGRRVVEREVGSLGAGRHTANLAEGRKVVPGIYWVRLVQGANRRAMRVAVIE